MHGEVRSRLLVYFSLRKTCMRCLFENLAFCPTHSSAILKFALGNHSSFSLVSFHLWHLCYNPRGTKTSLGRPTFSTRLKSLGLRMVQSLLFFVCLTMVSVFAATLPCWSCSAAHVSFALLHLQSPWFPWGPQRSFPHLIDSVITLQVIYVLSTFSSPWIILQQHFSLFLSSLCGGLGWLLTPSNHPTSLAIQGA